MRHKRGANDRNQTRNRLSTNQVLYQLSYIGIDNSSDTQAMRVGASVFVDIRALGASHPFQS